MHLLQSHNIEASMSGKGDCWDNAMMKSFWATLKNELVNHEYYSTREQARASIFEYIEVFYNRKRLHSSLGGLARGVGTFARIDPSMRGQSWRIAWNS